MGFSNKIRQFFGGNKKEIIIILVSITLGASLILINLFHYTTSTHKHTLKFNKRNKERMTIFSGEEFKTSFSLDSPDEISNLNIKMKFQNIDENLEVKISLNGKEVKTIKNLVGGSVQTISINKKNLEESNTLKITGNFEKSSKVKFIIEELVITGYTSLQRIFFLVLNLVGLIVIISPILILKYIEYSIKGKLEDRFPDFLRDVVEGTRAGMSLPQAVKNTEDNDYGALTHHVNAIIAKIDWGMPFEEVLRNFAEKSKSKIILRAVNTIVQTYKSGGNITEVLESVGSNLKEIKKLGSERETQLYGEMVTGYVVYFVFLGVLIGLMRYLIPALSFSGDIGPLRSGGGKSTKALIATYRPMFRNLIIIQSIFSGLVIGQLTKGEMKAGAKHVAILLGVGYTAAVIFM